MTKNPSHLTVKITETANWYKEGEIHQVLNHVVFGFKSGKPSFEKRKGEFGIQVDHCKIISNKDGIVELSLLDIENILGYKFKLIE